MFKELGKGDTSKNLKERREKMMDLGVTENMAEVLYRLRWGKDSMMG